MQPHDWARVKELFFAAIDEPEPTRRRDLLDRVCGGDRVLRREVEALLALDEIHDVPAPHPEGQPQAPGSPVDLQATHDPNCGKQLGAYRIIRELGSGGMGAVYLASRADGEFTQEVALKVIRRSVTDANLASRFRVERQILASLNHPHIARLLDGGVNELGEPFLVMEYVDGEPLLDFATGRRLGMRARLELFLKISSAVSYAHGKLVVHRDIKPSNVLVTGEGVPKLIDFGLAKILDTTLAEGDARGTMTAFRAFTPSYASPEQVHGQQITTASDVYSLGVVLYELLTGTTPFDFGQRSIVDILRTLEGTEPLHPSQALRRRAACAPLLPYSAAALEGDLDNIVQTALRREPDRRYASVAAMADDVRRHLKGLPVSAHPNTLAYRTRKFLRRRTAAVVGTALVVCAMVAGSGVSLWQARIARDQRDRATRRFDDVRRLSNSLLFELSPRIERLPGATDARDLLVRRALEYLDSLATESADDLVLQTELASAYEKIGDLQGNPTNPNLIELDAAIGSYVKARAIRLRVVERSGDVSGLDERRALAENYRVLGGINSQANDFESAARDLEEARRRYEELAAAAPANRSAQVAVAQTMHDIGRNHSNSSRYAGAIAPFEHAIGVAERVARETPDDVDVLRLLAETRAQYGLALSWEGRQAEGEAEMARAAAIYEPLVSKNPNDVSLKNGLWSVYWLTSSVYEEQNDALSHVFALKALATVRDIVEQDRANIRARQQLAKSLSRLGQTATNTGRSADAITFLDEACTILGEIAASESRNGRLRSELALALTRLAEARAAQGSFDAALADAERAVQIYDSLVGTFPDDRRSVRNLVLAHEIVGDIHNRTSGRPAGVSVQHRRMARASYKRGLDLLLRLRDQSALAESDAKLVDRLTAMTASLADDAP